MNIEEMLGKCNLREPSAGLKARIALATKDKWKQPLATIELRRSLWQVSVGLAASLLIAVTGIAANSGLVTQRTDNGALTSEEAGIIYSPELVISGMTRLHFPAGRWQTIDQTCLANRNKMINEELNKGG